MTSTHPTRPTSTDFREDPHITSYVCAISSIAVFLIWGFQAHYNLLITFNKITLFILASCLLIGGFFSYKNPRYNKLLVKTLSTLFALQMQTSWLLAYSLSSIGYCSYYLCCLTAFIPLLYVTSHFCFAKNASKISIINFIGFLISSLIIGFKEGDAKISLILLTCMLSHPIYILIVHYVLQLKKKNTVMELRQKELEWIAQTDGLTGLSNRQCLESFMLRDTIRTEANNFNKLGVILMDIDNFKRINDTLGHPAGDLVLKKVAEVLKNSVRADDFVARYGGEEFLCIINTSDFEVVNSICKRIKQDVSTISPGGTLPNVSVSIGFTTRRDNEQIADLIQKADGNLYVAKNTGKNKIVFN